MPNEELILVRTASGQAAVFDDILLTGNTMRLLRLFNGYTRLGDLAARLDAGHDWHALAFDLLDRGLVAESHFDGAGLSTATVDNPVDDR